MRKNSTLRAAALASVCLAPMTAAAQNFDMGGSSQDQDATPVYRNEIDIGARYQSSTSPLYGRYNGQTSKGFGSIGGFHVEGDSKMGSGAPLSFEATGRNLDFQPDHLGPNNALAPESEVSVSAGQQGVWKANLSYNAITYTGQTFLTPYNSAGHLSSGLAQFGGLQIPGYGGATQSVPGVGLQYFATHPLPLSQETAGTRRDIGGADGKYIIGDWTVTTGLRHEHKEGTVLQTIFGSAEGTAFPQPVNYDTDQYNIQGEYNTERLQAAVRYDYSKFVNNNTAFSAPFFTNSNGGGNTAQFTSTYSLPPSNDAHYISAMANYSLTQKTQANADFRYGIESSNVSLPSITGTPSGQLGYGMILNPGAATTQQMARVYNGTASIISRPLPKLDLKASYSIDGREVGSNPVGIYGAGYFEAETNSIYGGHYLTKNQSWTKQKVALEGSYRILQSTKATLGYSYDDVHRDAGDSITTGAPVGYWVGHSGENTITAKLSNNSIKDVHSSIAYEHAVRAGTYEYTTTALESGAFYQTPRTADRIRVRTDYMPTHEWNFGLNGKWEGNHYHYLSGQTGTQRDYNASIGPDVTYSPVKTIDLHAFYTYQEVFYDNRGNGVASTINHWGWDANTTDSIHTAGLSGTWKATDKLKLTADYTFSYGDIGYNLFDGISVANPTQSYQNVQNLPSISSSMHSFKLRGEYDLTSNISFMAGYGFDMYKDNDWAYGWNPMILSSGTITSLTSGESQSSYRVHSLYTSMRLKF
ncbi:MAG: MtrB/PioB family decaheme-associated outer membrane protein [Telmatospirillum sp.]|nr:MtrB/PioB family decaheme-associated outer membrane protein [Telmatospirillum sp.]